jgi:hypothetical protein
MKLATSSLSLIVAASMSVPVASSQNLPPKGSWQSIALTCDIAGGGLCASQVLGGIQMLEETKRICPDHNITAAEAWRIVNVYYTEHSDRRRMSGGLAAWVDEAATAKYRCTS